MGNNIFCFSNVCEYQKRTNIKSCEKTELLEEHTPLQACVQSEHEAFEKGVMKQKIYQFS
jgi:hypothetical protein